jgi:hypothetical protein
MISLVPQCKRSIALRNMSVMIDASIQKALDKVIMTTSDCQDERCYPGSTLSLPLTLISSLINTSKISGHRKPKGFEL